MPGPLWMPCPLWMPRRPTCAEPARGLPPRRRPPPLRRRRRPRGGAGASPRPAVASQGRDITASPSARRCWGLQRRSGHQGISPSSCCGPKQAAAVASDPRGPSCRAAATLEDVDGCGPGGAAGCTAPGRSFAAAARATCCATLQRGARQLRRPAAVCGVGGPLSSGIRHARAAYKTVRNGPRPYVQHTWDGSEARRLERGGPCLPPSPCC